MSQGCSRPVPERMAERVGGIDALDENHAPARVSAVSQDDLGLARGAIPFE